jgi:hypothetical protein
LTRVDPPAFTLLAELAPQLALACADDGSRLALNDQTGRVEFFATTRGLERLPLVIEPGHARAVLLDRGGACVYVLANEPRLDVLDFDERRLAEHPLDAHASEDDEGVELPEATHRRAILTTPSPVAWAMAAQIANANEGRRWLEHTLEPNADRLLWPDRFTRLAQAPGARQLAVLDTSCVVLDVEEGRVLTNIECGLDVGMLLEYGEGTHTIDFARDGLLMAATTSVSGNPYVELDWFDARVGAKVATCEVWQQRWPIDHEVHLYDPTTHPPPAAIPPDTFVVVFRRACTELWDHAGLRASWPRVPGACVIPSFDPGRPCRAPRTIELVDDRIELVDLVRGDRSPLALGLHPDALRWLEFLPEGKLFARTSDTLLLGSERGDRWARATLPEGRQIVRVALACAQLAEHRALQAFVLDDHDALWRVELVCPRPTSGLVEPRELEQLEAALLEHADDRERLAVLADALAEQGKPLGELIHLHLQDHADAAELLLARLAPQLLPGFAALPVGACSLAWRLGFVRELVATIDDREQLGSLLALLGSPALRLLESLTITLAPKLEARLRAELLERLRVYLSDARRWPRLRVSSLA